jgi:hypothetical protein
MSLRPPRPTSPVLPPQNRPAVDEWGIYDPSQAGLVALYEMLEARRLADPEPKTLLASMEEANRRLTKALHRDLRRR